jgi:hypothetical protein
VSSKHDAALRNVLLRAFGRFDYGDAAYDEVTVAERQAEADTILDALEAAGYHVVSSRPVTPCRSGHTDCTVDCGWCKGTGVERRPVTPGNAREHGVYARIVIGHEHFDDELDYHEWITSGERVKADRRGHPNPRMTYAYWSKWICNNAQCSAWALVSDDGVKALIEAAEVSS